MKLSLVFFTVMTLAGCQSTDRSDSHLVQSNEQPNSANAATLDRMSINFVRMHRRARQNVHFPGHPDSDTIYRIGINSDGVRSDTSADDQVTHVRLARLPDQVLIDSAGSSATQEMGVIVDDDANTPPPDFDGTYELQITLQSGEVVVRQFSTTSMNSETVPSLIVPEDCQVMASDQPRYTWANSNSQDSNLNDLYNLNIKLVTHTGTWHEVLAQDLPKGSTAFSVATDASSQLHLANGTYRVFITETFSHQSDGLTLKRVAMAARAFVIGNGAICD